MSRFDNVDLGGDASMRRLVAAKQRERDELIEKCARVAEGASPEAAALIRAMKGQDHE